MAARALRRLGISPGQLPQPARPATTQGQRQPESPPRPHPAEGVIPAALAEATARDYHIGTQHLLLALYRADDQAAARALAGLGAAESQVRDAITAVLADTGPDRPA